eukprot:scaffold16275_cov118-Isochrysis_galbana.AAC.3
MAIYILAQCARAPPPALTARGTMMLKHPCIRITDHSMTEAEAAATMTARARARTHKIHVDSVTHNRFFLEPHSIKSLRPPHAVAAVISQESTDTRPGSGTRRPDFGAVSNMAGESGGNVASRSHALRVQCTELQARPSLAQQL